MCALLYQLNYFIKYFNKCIYLIDFSIINILHDTERIFPIIYSFNPLNVSVGN